MQLVKVKFLKNDKPQGIDYTYLSNEELKIDDIVNVNGKANAVVTEVNVSETAIESFKDKVKTLVGKVVNDSLSSSDT